ncbi:MAG: TIGR03915 family putative DNA repair protein [Defluviitaleaceae bacterium]|nr:TIGR03915 family putative DNA repair protein [Defluviitaleaceae bacterium]
MPGYKIVALPTDVIYVYDGSLPGFLCCVHESFYGKELPINIVNISNHEPSLYEQKVVMTDEIKARAVRESIGKISPRVLEITDHVFLCHHANKELKLLKFLITAFRIGANAPLMLGEAEVADVLAMERHMMGERHLLLGFIRFKDYGDILSAVISPKNFVLPLLAEHFIGRYPNENFMIYDKTYKAALIYQDKKLEMTAVEEIDFKEEPEEEVYYQDLWKKFYKTIGIEERLNPRCRMSHMPKRYWANMTEMQEATVHNLS